MPIQSYDFHILGIHGHGRISNDFAANMSCDVHVGLAVALIERRQRSTGSITNILPGQYSSAPDAALQF